MNAMIFAAGLGTRLKPLTDTKPKALVRVGDKTLLDHTIEKLCAAGATEIVINVHHFADQIKDHLFEEISSSKGGALCLTNSLPNIKISDETAALLDTGGGLKKAIPLFSRAEPILIHNVDILSNVNLADFYQKAQNNDVTLLVSKRKTTRYLLFNDDMRLVGWTNIQTGEIKSPYPEVKELEGKDITKEGYQMYAFSGIHIFSPRLFPLMKDFSDKFSIMDFYLKVCAEVNICGCYKEDLRLLDVGKIESLAIAEDFIKQTSQNYSQAT